MTRSLSSALGLVALAILAYFAFTAFDPVSQQQRASQAAYQAQAQSLDLQRQQAEQKLALDQQQAIAPIKTFAAALWQLVPLVVLCGGLGFLCYQVAAERRRKRGLLQPDMNGLYPIDTSVLSTEIAQQVTVMLASGAMQTAVERARVSGQAPHTLTYSPRIAGDRAAQPAPLLLEDSQSAPGLPTAPSFSQILASGWRPSSQQMLLGYGQSGPIHGGIESLLSTAIAGRPGQGKTTALRFIYAQTIMAGGQVVILDPHGSIADAVGESGALWTASTAGELDDGGAWLHDELERRGAAYRAGERTFSPLLLLADEFPIISLQSKTAVDAASRVILEARKWGGFALISGQGLPADRFKGSLVRDALSSRYIFKTTAAQGRMAGLDKSAAQLLDQLDPGRCVLDGPVEAQIVAIPNTTALDLTTLARTGASTPGERGAMASAMTSGLVSHEGSGKPLGSPWESNRDLLSSPSQSASQATPEEARIISLFRAGQDVPAIVKEVYQVSAGRAYQQHSADVQQALRRAIGGA
jgi:hypothetical protein